MAFSARLAQLWFRLKENNMNMPYMRAFELLPPDEIHYVRPAKPMNTRTRKTAWKERRRLANAPRSIRKRALKRR